MKRIFLIHGWDGNPENNWFPWLKKNLESKDLKVESLSMPNPEEPEIESWTKHLENSVGEFNEETYFVGHSIGCQTILRTLQDLGDKTKIGGLVLVAPFVRLKDLETKEEEDIARPWLTEPIDFDKIKEMVPEGKLTCIFSDNDPCVMVEDADIFKEKLDAKIIVEEGMGHFSDDEEVCELPSALEELQRIIEK